MKTLKLLAKVAQGFGFAACCGMTAYMLTTAFPLAAAGYAVGAYFLYDA